MAVYTGFNNSAAQVGRVYTGVNGVACQITKAYIGMNGVACQVPIFSVIQNDGLTLDVLQGGAYIIQLNATEVETFDETVMQLIYDPSTLELEELSLEDPEKTDDAQEKSYAGNQLHEVTHLPGCLQFQSSQQIREDHDWSGLVLTVRFRALRAGSAHISLS